VKSRLFATSISLGRVGCGIQSAKKILWIEIYKELSLYSVNKLIDLAIDAARDAGVVIMRHYMQALTVHYKQDHSPLTLADLESHHVIFDRLALSGLTVVSEEGDDLQLEAQRYWLVDPLDGTKDFLAGNDQFTVNIALIDRGRPVIGVVYAPASDDLFWGAGDKGAHRIGCGVTSLLSMQARAQNLRMAISRFHDHPDVEKFAAQNAISQRVAIGSALKYGLLASAEVDVFPRLVGSSEWDTAAGQCVLEAAGGLVLDWNTGKSLIYGKPRRRNPRLLAIRSPYRYLEFKLEYYQKELL